MMVALRYRSRSGFAAGLSDLDIWNSCPVWWNGLRTRSFMPIGRGIFGICPQPNA